MFNKNLSYQESIILLRKQPLIIKNRDKGIFSICRCICRLNNAVILLGTVQGQLSCLLIFWRWHNAAVILHSPKTMYLHCSVCCNTTDLEMSSLDYHCWLYVAALYVLCIVNKRNIMDDMCQSICLISAYWKEFYWIWFWDYTKLYLTDLISVHCGPI
jgi:hypothetical protein